MGERTEFVRFQSLEFDGTPWTRWVSSLAIHTAALALLIAIPVTVRNVVEPRSRVVVASLTAPILPAPSKPVPKPVRTVSVRPPIPKPVTRPAPRVPFRAPPVQSAVSRKIALPAAPVEVPKAPEIARVEAPKIELPSRAVVKETGFPPSVAVASSNPPAPGKIVKTGGFGDPNGVQPSATSTRNSTLRAAGFADAPAGQGSAQSSGGRARAVASAGFGDEKAAPVVASNHGPVSGAGFGAAVEGPPAASNRGPVQGAGFGEYAPSGRQAAPAARAAAPVETPVEITYKPKPVYTAEAREKKIEGEVQLEVLFSSTGEAKVLRVVRGLGFGLDESARAAAGRIRFRPGTRNGNPVDMTGTVHIVFELS